MAQSSDAGVGTIKALAEARQWLGLWKSLDELPVDASVKEAVITTLETAGDQHAAHGDTAAALRCYHFAMRAAKGHTIAAARYLDSKYARAFVGTLGVSGFEREISQEIIALAASGRFRDAEELLPVARTLSESAEMIEDAADDIAATNRQVAEWLYQKLIERVFNVRETAYGKSWRNFAMRPQPRRFPRSGLHFRKASSDLRIWRSPDPSPTPGPS